MTVPEGLPNSNSLVCKLQKSLYGLKQASRQWYAKLAMELNTQGFIQSHSDASLFIKRNGHLITVVAVYVDDIILTGDDVTSIRDLKSHLHKTFSIKDLGHLHYFLGIEVNYTPTGIILTQRKFI